jgi:hypothetical protein
MNIAVHIERLILDGLPVKSYDAPAVRAAVERELARLLSGQGVGSSLQVGGVRDNLRAGSIQLAHDSGAALLGHEIGRALHAAISNLDSQRERREVRSSSRPPEQGVVAPRSPQSVGVPR